MISIVSVVDQYNDISHKMDNSQASITNKIKRNTILSEHEGIKFIGISFAKLTQLFFFRRTIKCSHSMGDIENCNEILMICQIIINFTLTKNFIKPRDNTISTPVDFLISLLAYTESL